VTSAGAVGASSRAPSAISTSPTPTPTLVGSLTPGGTARILRPGGGDSDSDDELEMPLASFMLSSSGSGSDSEG
jgi:hypothetical protein